MGRWTSIAFLQYIHNHIAYLSKDIMRKMNIELPFVNMAAIYHGRGLVQILRNIVVGGAPLQHARTELMHSLRVRHRDGQCLVPNR